MSKIASALISLSLIATATICSAASNAYACSCGDKPSLEKSVSDSSVVFLGRAQSVRQNPLRPSQKEVTFGITKLFKDDTRLLANNGVTIYTALEESLCGYSFSPNQDYLVFATGNIARLTSSLCSRNGLLEAVKGDVLELEKQQDQAASSSSEDPSKD